MKWGEQSLVPFSDQLRNARRGDHDALLQLVGRHEGELRRSLQGKIDARLQSLLNDDDVIQETYADAFLSFEQFQGTEERELIRWLQTLLRNNLMDAVKGLRAAKRGGAARTFTQSFDESALNLLTSLRDPGLTASAQLRAEEAAQLLRDAVQHLPEEYRKVVICYDLEGCSPEQAAAHCHCSVGAMYMRRSRAHQLLRRILDR